MPRRRDKKCQSAVDTPCRRAVIESLDICSYRRETSPHNTTSVTVVSCPQAETPCSCYLSSSSLRENSCTGQPFSNNSHNPGKTYPMFAPSNNQNQDNSEVYICPGSCIGSNTQRNEDNQTTQSPSYHEGCNVNTIKGANAEFGELQNGQQEEMYPYANLPMCCAGSGGQQMENQNMENAIAIQESQTKTCPSKIPSYCTNEPQNPNSSCPAFAARDSQTMTCPSKIPSYCTNDPQNPNSSCPAFAAPQHQQLKHTDPIRRTAVTQANKLSECNAQTDASGLGIDHVQPKCCSSPVCGLELDKKPIGGKKNIKKPDSKTTCSCAKGGKKNIKEPDNNTCSCAALDMGAPEPDNNTCSCAALDMSAPEGGKNACSCAALDPEGGKKNIIEPNSKTCSCADPIMGGAPKKCSCHFPPAYNQFGCTGNISGNCKCDNNN